MREGAAEAIGGFTNQSPGCPQGMILAPVAAWLRLPGSCSSRQLNILNRSATLGSPRSRPRGRAYVLPSARECADAALVTLITVLPSPESRHGCRGSSHGGHRDSGHGSHCRHGSPR